ncbi:hypothetical protein MJO28_008301 [Puccinia striiformis f. sp. tritici]|uniref:Uncharacterized protein n=1 Tax=Puccinia striiformis f. sp. tritici TaxID=168172 RepID=A0ACC0EDH7_9BASI|nr:hypothetical protein MJO28_008301 [Puccinia striiformis f. sp. tritici]
MISSRGLDESFTDSSKADVLTRVTELPINVKDEAEIEPRHQPLHSLIQGERKRNAEEIWAKN